MRKPSVSLRIFILLLPGLALWGLMAACSSQPAPTAAGKTSAAAGGVWTDFTLYAVSPADLTPAQKQRFQNMSMGAPGFLAGANFSPSGLAARSNLQLRGMLMRESWHRDGLAIWKLEGQVLLPASRSASTVRQTQIIEIGTQDAGLAPQSFSGAYPDNQLILVALRRATAEAGKAGITQGTARIASLQYDSDKGRFRVRVEIL